MHTLFAWILRAMVALEPTSTPGHTPADVAAWPALAHEIADSAELYPIAGSTRWTAAVMVVYAWHESRFRWAPCGEQWDCDHGRSVGAWQTASHWGSPGAALTLLLMHESDERCHELLPELRLSGYAWGPDCDHRHAMVRARVAQAETLLRDVVF